MTVYELRDKARMAAYKHVFANVGGVHWPVDPEGFLTRAVLARKSVDQISNGGIDGEVMEVVEAYEKCDTYDIVEILDSITVNIIHEFREVTAA
jgi:hypothetical protein